MFGNTEDLSKIKPLTYAQAIKCKPKKGVMIFSTPVLWNKKLEKEATQKVKFHSLDEEVNVIVPKIIDDKLPEGYRMERHPSWEELRKRIYNPYKNKYTFEQLETFIKDSEVFQSLGIDIYIPNGDSAYYLDDDDVEESHPEIHEEFWDYYFRYSDQWEEWEDYVREFFKESINCYIRDRFQRGNQPPQIPAPDKHRAIAEIIVNFKSRLKQEIRQSKSCDNLDL